MEFVREKKHTNILKNIYVLPLVGVVGYKRPLITSKLRWDILKLSVRLESLNMYVSLNKSRLLVGLVQDSSLSALRRKSQQRGEEEEEEEVLPVPVPR